MDKLTIPIFPLHTVLFPGGALPLRIFEPRYVDMVSDCLKHDSAFGVCLIREGSEVGNAASTYPVGTLGRISYWQKLPDGLLGITLRGEHRFEIVSEEILDNQLTMAEVQLLADEPEGAVPAQYQSLVTILEQIFEQMGEPYIHLPRHYDDVTWVSHRLTELLPIPLTLKQDFLQLSDPAMRLERLSGILKEMDIH